MVKYKLIRDNSYILYGGQSEHLFDINSLYDDNIFVNISNETQNLFQKDNYASTYGELTQEGMKQMLEGIDTNGKVYYDLGSGLGKTVLSAVLDHNFNKAIGIELATERYNIAENALTMIPEQNRNNIEFHNKDFFDPSISLTDADVVFISSLCFPEQILNKLSTKCNDELKPGSYVFSSKELNASKLRLINTKPVKMTWQDNSNIYIYLVSSV
jgi:hypothetical protein